MAVPEIDLDRIRERIREIDIQLVALAAERVRLAREVGEIKRQANLATVDYAQERVVLDRARSAARDHALDEAVAADLVARMIRASVSAQEEDRLRFAATGAGKSAVIVGGAGRMGKWMARFLAAQGYTVGALDPAAGDDENRWSRERLAAAELIVCATAPGTTAHLYRDWLASPPSGTIVDLASIKTPLVGAIHKLVEAGGRVASIHPMFGPETFLLRDADVVVCDTGHDGARAEIESLFEPTTARLVRLPLEDHDHIMADLLALAHATAIAFALSLPETDQPIHSTTFHQLEAVARVVVRESADVYYEIQAANPHSLTALERLRNSLDRIIEAVHHRGLEEFKALMEEGRQRTQSE